MAIESASELTGDREGEHAGVPGDDPQQAEDTQPVDTGKRVLCFGVEDLLQISPGGEAEHRLHCQCCNTAQHCDV